MKNIKIIFLLTALVFTSYCQAQDYYEDDLFTYDETYLSFTQRLGRVISTSEESIGNFSRVKATIATVEDLTSKESLSALQFELETNNTYAYGEMIATIDEDEFDRLLQGVERVHDLLVSDNAVEERDVVYRTREGMTYGGSVKDGEVRQYVQVTMYNDMSYIHLDEEGYQEFLALLMKAKSML